MFDQREKDTNSFLNTFDSREQQILIANYYRQDAIWPGHTMQASFHYDLDAPTLEYDRNGFLVRPDPVGIAQPHQVNAAYLGLATDGGLYVPSEVPPLPQDWHLERPYAELAAAVMWPYVEGSIERGTFDAVVADSYRTFDHPDVVPMRELDTGLYLAELFWGPTLAFKDVALQLVGRLFDQELGRRGDRVEIAVADRGPGVPEAERERIFERFGRGAAAAHTRAPGLGLGLALSRETARLMGGDIGVAPRPGGGSVFTLELPAAPAAAIPATAAGCRAEVAATAEMAEEERRALRARG